MNTGEDQEFSAALEEALARFGVGPLAGGQALQLAKHYSMLREWNRRMNLTRIIEAREAARLHYGESLFGGRFIRDAKTILDIGSGAGFPGLPLAVLRPDVEVTALEANQKKSLFLNEAKDALGLANFKVATARLESFDWRAYDLLTSRALDRAESMLPPVIKSLAGRQRFLLYCSRDLLEKIDGPCEVEIHPIPQAETRILAIFSAQSVKREQSAD
jgi:16S rRNA (guanine527-N7)-methyltransferase